MGHKGKEIAVETEKDPHNIEVDVGPSMPAGDIEIPISEADSNDQLQPARDPSLLVMEGIQPFSLVVDLQEELDTALPQTLDIPELIQVLSLGDKDSYGKGSRPLNPVCCEMGGGVEDAPA